MTLQEKISADLQAALREREALRLEVIRSIKTAFSNELVAKGRGPQGELNDDEAITILKRLGKQRQEAAEQFRAGARPELAEKEEKEYQIISEYLPAQLSDEEIKELIKVKMSELGINDKSKMGQLIGAVAKAAGATADGKRIKELIEQEL